MRPAFQASCLALLVGVLLVSCASSATCTPPYRYGLDMNIPGAVKVGAEQACSVRVAVTDDTTYNQDATCEVVSAGCHCLGAGDRPGRYTITVFLGDRVVASKAVVVGMGDCGIRTEEVTLTLP